MLIRTIFTYQVYWVSGKRSKTMPCEALLGTIELTSLMQSQLGEQLPVSDSRTQNSLYAPLGYLGVICIEKEGQ